jgi:hypothetical protein
VPLAYHALHASQATRSTGGPRAPHPDLTIALRSAQLASAGVTNALAAVLEEAPRGLTKVRSPPLHPRHQQGCLYPHLCDSSGQLAAASTVFRQLQATPVNSSQLQSTPVNSRRLQTSQLTDLNVCVVHKPHPDSIESASAVGP